MSDNALEFLTTEEMVNELARRNSGVLLALIENRAKNEEGFSCWYRGGFTQAIGMAARVMRDMETQCGTKDEHVE